MDSRARALAYELFEVFISGLEQEEMYSHFRLRAGREATPEEIETISTEWIALQRYLNRRHRQLEREAENSENVDPSHVLP